MHMPDCQCTTVVLSQPCGSLCVLHAGIVMPVAALLSLLEQEKLFINQLHKF